MVVLCVCVCVWVCGCVGVCLIYFGLLATCDRNALDDLTVVF